jgi:hypothetical protein
VDFADALVFLVLVATKQESTTGSNPLYIIILLIATLNIDFPIVQKTD